MQSIFFTVVEKFYCNLIIPQKRQCRLPSDGRLAITMLMISVRMCGNVASLRWEIGSHYADVLGEDVWQCRLPSDGRLAVTMLMFSVRMCGDVASLPMGDWRSGEVNWYGEGRGSSMTLYRYYISTKLINYL